MVVRALEREVAPEPPKKFEPKFKLVNEELAERTLERTATPEASILTPVKSKLLM